MPQHHSRKNNANSSNGQSRRWLPQQHQRTPKPLHQQPPYHHSYQPPIYHVQTNRTTLHQAKMPMSNYGYSKWSNTSASPTSRKNATWSTRQHFFAAQPFRGGVPNYSTIDHYPPPGTISRKSCNKHFHPLIKSNGHETNFRVYDRHTQFKTTSGDSRACALTSPTLSKGKSWIALYGDSKHQLEKKSNSAASQISRKFYKRHKGWTPSITRPAVPSPTHHFTEAPRKNRHQWNSEFYKEDLHTKNNKASSENQLPPKQSTNTSPPPQCSTHPCTATTTSSSYYRSTKNFSSQKWRLLLLPPTRTYCNKLPNPSQTPWKCSTPGKRWRAGIDPPRPCLMSTPFTLHPQQVVRIPVKTKNPFSPLINLPAQAPTTITNRRIPLVDQQPYRPSPSIPNKDKPGHLDVNHEQLLYEEDLVLSPVSSTKLPCMHANAPPSPCNK